MSNKGRLTKACTGASPRTCHGSHLPCGFGPVMPGVRPRSQIRVGSDMLSQPVADKGQSKHNAAWLQSEALTQKESPH
jgi:hypothetical protein